VVRGWLVFGGGGGGWNECLAGVLYLGSLASFLHSRFPYDFPPVVQLSVGCLTPSYSPRRWVFFPISLAVSSPTKNLTLIPSRTTRPYC